jgi:hypothetical protein
VLPEVTPVPTTATSRPFLSAAAVLEAGGYVEEEFFLSGPGRTYDWVEPGRSAQSVTPAQRYVNRILVRRPRDAARFSGNVEVNLLNASIGFDLGGPTDAARMFAQGDVWIGVTTKAVAAQSLKRFDATRYAPLDWSNPAPPAQRCAYPTIIPAYMIGDAAALEAMSRSGRPGSSPDTEDGLIWDMLGQLGALLKSAQREKILPGFAQPYVYMTGTSQSSILMRTWLAGFHDRFRTADGKPVYDGYLGVVGPAMLRINQCAQDIALADIAQKLTPPDVPFISLSSEGEMWLARHTHQPDAFTERGGIVSYEVTGGSHNAGDVVPPRISAMPAPEDMAKLAFSFAGMAGAQPALPEGAVPNDLQWAPLVRGAYANLQRWVRDGVRPPQARGIEVGADLEIRRDANGNALGGVRTPYVDAPVACFTGYLSAGGMGSVMGFKRPFAAEALAMLYPARADYLATFGAAADRMVAERWISRADADAMIKAASAQMPE